ncbi:MAG: type II toxin-antitoxin system YafQ family toxin [Bacteroides sp.]|nr:type II toxin-antitoxin system YafQ family toxin [Eubacterium sp.]MCM1417495.1 type II toxin-antitoxin system YafQ family toxin [Roseburia sp.]MCM1462919.1 type II toxin-antitoxin system YafQ family toxin [Bacteroides sp.]
MTNKYQVVATSIFKKDYKRLIKRNYNVAFLNEVVSKLQRGEKLSESNNDHALTGNWKGYRECHIQPDWLLIYKVYNDKLVLSLTRTGTHSDMGF